MIKNDFAAELEAVIATDEILGALERVLASKSFIYSHRLSQFLRFAVEQSLDGRKDRLKEYTIGTQVYGRKPDFDPSQDSIVRAEARRLRTKLKEYREGEGQNDDVVIIFRPGSYVPIYERRASLVCRQLSECTQTSNTKIDPRCALIGVTAFQSPVGDQLADSFALSLTDELVHRLAQVVRVQILWLPTGKPRSYKDSPEPESIVGGVVRTEGNRLFITARVATASGLVLWSRRFELPFEDCTEAALCAVTNSVLHRITERAADNHAPSVIHIPAPKQRPLARKDFRAFPQVRDAS